MMSSLKQLQMLACRQVQCLPDKTRCTALRLNLCCVRLVQATHLVVAAAAALATHALEHVSAADAVQLIDCKELLLLALSDRFAQGCGCVLCLLRWVMVNGGLSWG